jgi:diguanylate cyclase (GGDEF)-like protein
MHTAATDRAVFGPPANPPGGPLNPRRRIWLAVAGLLVAVGALGSVMAARTVTQNDAQKARQTFTATSTQIASTLKLTIEHEQDLSVDAGAFFVGNPNPSGSEFSQWIGSVRAFQRYPELQGLAEIVMVSAAQLPAFAARAVTDPAGPLASDGTFQVVPAGSRSYYCFEAVSQSRSGAPPAPAGVDYCDTALGPILLKARNSGQGAYLPFGTGRATELVVGIPIYRGGVVPTTANARDEAFIGWTGIEIRPSVLLDAALDGHPGLAVAFQYTSGSTRVTFKMGGVPARAQSTTIDLHNGWHVRTFAATIARGVLGDPYSLAPLIGGILLSLLLGVLLYLLGTSRSRAVLQLHERTGQLRHQALHDSLTGLPNRALILDRIEQMLARARRTHVSVAALFLDLDNFKDINDSLGHSAGDQLLAAVAERLSGALREGDTVGRLGGDEFVVLLEGPSLAAGSEVVAKRILEALDAPFEIERSEVPLSVAASIGIAEGDRSSSEELLRDADIALYQAKAGGRRRAVIYASSMQHAVDQQRILAVDLHRALQAGQFFLLYQPSVELSTGMFTGVEALLRWNHPGRGVVQPDRFIPTLEASSLIIPVGQWVLAEACRQGARWHSQGHRIVVSVNISAKQLERDGIIDDVRDALSASGFDPTMLILELTETYLMTDVDATVTRLKLLKTLGVRLAVDDFGTGYSTLAYLRQFPIDVLKIDQSFVSEIADSKASTALVHTLVQLGKLLGLETMAEGIETDDQRQRLLAEGVDGGQGFFFARPLNVAAVDHLMQCQSVQRSDAELGRTGLLQPDPTRDAPSVLTVGEDRLSTTADPTARSAGGPVGAGVTRAG